MTDLVNDECYLYEFVFRSRAKCIQHFDINPHRETSNDGFVTNQILEQLNVKKRRPITYRHECSYETKEIQEIFDHQKECWWSCLSDEYDGQHKPDVQSEPDNQSKSNNLNLQKRVTLLDNITLFFHGGLELKFESFEKSSDIYIAIKDLVIQSESK